MSLLRNTYCIFNLTVHIYFYNKKSDFFAHFRIFYSFSDFYSNRAAEFFKRSWELYGKGCELSEEKFLRDYLAKTTVVTNYMNSNALTDTPFNQTIYNYWIDLYGSPLPNYFPGIPANSSKVSTQWNKDKD